MVTFLDTYAIMEIYKGNPNFSRFQIDPASAVTTYLNLMEAYFVCLKDFGEEEAEKIYAAVMPIAISIEAAAIIKSSMKFKLKNQKSRMSFVDCIGYTYARALNTSFLTGDYAFKGMEGVEFVR